MIITAVTRSDSALLDGINALLPQLTPTAPLLSAPQLEQIVASDCSRLYIAVEAGQVAGMLTLAIFPIPMGVRAWIEDLVVAKTVRGRGIARQMVQRALAHAKSRGADNVNLTANTARKAANALYRRMGFELRATNTYRYDPHQPMKTNRSKEKKP